MRTIFICLLTFSLVGGCTLFVDFEPLDKKETNCIDGVDNDDDGYTDCEDPECWTASHCTGEDCFNGIDDDEDGFIDCEDPECFSDPNCVTTWEDCENSIDDDGDGWVDCDDPDCEGSFLCAPREICNNRVDDDGDGWVDCEDPDCFGIDGCNNPDGEYDCGNSYDDDMDGLRDCGDPDCEDSILCQPLPLAACVAHVPFTTNFGNVNYYKDIYQSGMTTECGNGSYCGIRPEVSLIPHCYPQETDVATAYQPCSGSICGPGLVCVSPVPGEQELCLPLCAPGYNVQCVGSGSVCFRHWTNNFDYHINKEVQLWTCGRPMCDPMNVVNNGCTNTTAGCYPSTDLFGDAVCVFPAGNTPLLMQCPNGDHQCMPGHVCRMGADDDYPVCRKLCKDLADCPSSPGATCQRDDSRQLFGYCR